MCKMNLWDTNIIYQQTDLGFYVLLYHQLAMKWPSLIINSSLPIGCQFIWETRLTLKSHKMILEKSWWSSLVVVVAIVIAVVIAVVIVIVQVSNINHLVRKRSCNNPICRRRRHGKGNVHNDPNNLLK